MDKRRLHHTWRQLRQVHAWYFLGCAIFFAGLGVYSLRQNNLGSVRLLQNVNHVDQQNGDIEAALRELRNYMYSHMNSQLASDQNAIRPPIQLKYRYERLVKAEKDRVAAHNAAVAAEAHRQCGADVPCAQRYISSNNIIEQLIPDSLYKFDFASPVWSPDRAGLSLVASGVFFILFAVRLVLEWWLKHSLRQ